MYTELTHVELKSAEGDPYFKFPEWTPGSLKFREHHDQPSDKKQHSSHMLTQFPSTVLPPPPPSHLRPQLHPPPPSRRRLPETI